MIDTPLLDGRGRERLMPKWMSKPKRKVSFEQGKVYLMRYNHYAFGGGHWQIKCNRLTDDGMALLGNKWYSIKSYLASRTIVSCIGSADKTDTIYPAAQVYNQGYYDDE